MGEAGAVGTAGNDGARVRHNGIGQSDVRQTFQFINGTSYNSRLLSPETFLSQISLHGPKTASLHFVI